MGSSVSLHPRSYMDILFDWLEDPPFPDIPTTISNQLLSTLCFVTFAIELEHKYSDTINARAFVKMVDRNCAELGVCYDSFVGNSTCDKCVIHLRIEGVLRNVIVIFRGVRNDKRVHSTFDISYSYPQIRTIPPRMLSSERTTDAMYRILSHQKHYLLHHNGNKSVFLVENTRTRSFGVLKEVLISDGDDTLTSVRHASNEFNMLTFIHTGKSAGDHTVYTGAFVSSDDSTTEREYRSPRYIAREGIVPIPDTLHEVVRIHMVYPMYQFDLLELLVSYSYVYNTSGLPPPIAIIYIYQLLNIINTLNESRVVHRDIKPDNICIDIDGNMVLIDFELAQKPTATHAGVPVGTVVYSAPETRNCSYSNMSDLWASGIVMIELFSDEFPFGLKTETPTDDRVYSKITQISERCDNPKGVPEDIWRLICVIFSDHKTRPKAKAMMQCELFDQIRAGPFQKHSVLQPVRDLFAEFGMLNRPNIKRDNELFKQLKRLDKRSYKS